MTGVIGTAAPPQPGAWTQIPEPAPFAVSMLLLLTDGTVLCQAFDGNGWSRLRPDNGGRYATGRWEPCGNSTNAPLYYASAVLRSGKVFLAGGEYNWGQQVDLCAAEMFDPATATWSAIATPPGWTKIGDAPCCVLPDGRVLVGSIEGKPCAIFDPDRYAWTDAGEKQNGTCDEETWTLLPDGSVLTADCYGEPATERYINGAWREEGKTPVPLVETASIEIGPAVLLPSGLVLAIGATGNTAIFAPDASSANLGKWTAGPTFPQDNNGRQLGAKDAPACLLPSGRVLCAVGPVDGQMGNYLAPTTFFEFDPSKPLTSALGKLQQQPGNANREPYYARLLLLPSGEVMFANCTNDVWFYQPDGAPNRDWAPTITTVERVLTAGNSYALAGTQLNGMSQACAYGDDVSLATNYPLVRLRSDADGTVVFCPTSGHSTMGVATGKTPVTTRFAIPGGVQPGTYQLSVVANAIASEEISVSVAKSVSTTARPPVAAAAPGASRRAARLPANGRALAMSPPVYGGLAVLILLGTFWANICLAPDYLLNTWFGSLAAVALSIALVGRANGRWQAAFIDNRNRMSLSKLQVFLWTVMIFAAMLSAACFNAKHGDWSDIMKITVTKEVWGLLGISLTAAVGAPIALSAKTLRNPSDAELQDTKTNLMAMTGVEDAHVTSAGHVLVKAELNDARWSDLVRGDEVGNGDMIDFSKVQHLYFTLLALVMFGYAVAMEFAKTADNAVRLAAHQQVMDINNHALTKAIIDQLPAPDTSFLYVLAASGAGYLLYKASSHSQDA